MAVLRGLLLAGVAFAASLVLLGSGASAANAETVVGTWSCCGEGGAGQQTWSISESGGSLSGSASFPGGEPFSPISGHISGSSVEIVTGPYNNSSYSATFLGTISGETMSGTWTSNAGQEGTWTAMRTSTAPPNSKEEEEKAAAKKAEEAKKKKEEEEKSGKRKSAIQVNCSNLELYSPSNHFQCTAQVGDASGQSPAKIPSGTVAFAISPGGDGSFQGSSTCALAPSQTGGASSFCAVNYLPRPGGIPIGEQPPVSATYSGDAVFIPISGQPQSSVATATMPEPGYKACAAPASALALRTPAFAPPAPASGLNNLDARLAAMKPSSVTVGTRPSAKRGRTLPRRQADLRALKLVRPAKAPRAGGVKLYGLLKPLRAGSVVTEASLGGPHPLLPPLRVKTSAWLYWEDLGPGQSFVHPSEVLLLSARGGHVLARALFSTYPEVDGRAAAFVSSRNPHVLYYRLPAPNAHPISLSRAELKRIKSAEGLASSLARKALAHKSDQSKSQLITIVSKASADPSDTFASEENAMMAVFAAHGVDTRSTANPTGLSRAVGEAAAAGKTDITIYIDGHGLSASSTSQPTVSLELGAGVVMTPEEFAATNAIRADQLATIVQAHPDVKFNFIIDSCYSGRFVEPLGAEPNVNSVTTSSSATQISWGPLKIEMAKGLEPPKTSEPEDRLVMIKEGVLITPPSPKAPTPDGDISIVGDARPGAISPFTTAMVAAINAGFVAEGLGASIPSVLKYARSVEPEYDLAVADGRTTPSRDITLSPNPTCVPASTPEPEPTGGWITGE